MDGRCDCWSSALGFGPTCSEFTDATTCNGKGTVQLDGSCACWSPALGYGPTCSEWTNRDTCNGNGVVQIDGTCVCSDPQVGEGPSCVEYTNKETCSDQGIAQPDGTCACYSPELGIGPDCSPELTNAASCSSAGTASMIWSWQIEEEAEAARAAAAATVPPVPTVASLSDTDADRNSIRLVDAYGNTGPNVIRGRLDLVHNQQWSTVCDDGWDKLDGYVACRQLGFTSYVAAYDAAAYNAAGGVGSIMFDDFACNGTEHSLYECTKTEGSSDCSHAEDVGIQCANAHCGDCLVGATQTGSAVNYEICAPCSAQVWFQYASAGSSGSYDYGSSSIAASCFDNKWISSSWSAGNDAYSIKFNVGLSPVHSESFPRGSLWVPGAVVNTAYTVSSEGAALENGALSCSDMAETDNGRYATSTTANTTTTTTKAVTTLTATLGPNRTTTTATTSTTTHTYEARCECWDTTQAYGPTCSEFVAKDVCSENGIFNQELSLLGVRPSCVCGSQRVGYGVSCNEGLLSEASRCNGRGIPLFPDGCDCFSGALGEGPTCSEYTDAVTCNGKGEVQHDGSCICYDPAIGTGPTCTEYSNAATCGVKGRHGDEKGIATPDGGCFWLCDVYYGGHNRCRSEDDDDDNSSPVICGKCEGDCDDDSDCLPGLLCMIRDDDDSGYKSVTALFTNSMGERVSERVYVDVALALPGCFAHNGRGLKGKNRDEDFCYDPRDVVVHNHQMSYKDHCSQGAGKRKGPVRAAIVCSCLAVLFLCWWFYVDCWPTIRDARRERVREKGLKRVFGRANPVICRSLAGEMFLIEDWAFCNDLVAELQKQHPTLVVDDGMSIALVHPAYGKIHPRSMVWRDGMLDQTISVDNIALVFEPTDGAKAPDATPVRAAYVEVGNESQDVGVPVTLTPYFGLPQADDRAVLNPMLFESANARADTAFINDAASNNGEIAREQSLL